MTPGNAPKRGDVIGSLDDVIEVHMKGSSEKRGNVSPVPLCRPALPRPALPYMR